MTSNANETSGTLSAPAEAGFSTNFGLVSKGGLNFQFTFRGATAGDWPGVWEQVRAFMDWAHSAGFSPAGARAVQPAAPAALAQPAGQQPEPPAQPNTAGLTPDVEGPDGATKYELRIARCVVRPEPGDKVSLELYEGGRKFADLKAQKWARSRAASLLAPVTAQDLTQPAELAVSWVATYVLGREYLKSDGTGGRYKDLVGIRAA